MFDVLNSRTGQFYGRDYKLHKNSQGLYKIYFKDMAGWRYLVDSDEMVIMASSYISTDKVYSSKESALKDAIKYFETPRVEDLQDITSFPVKDDFKELD